MPCLFNDLLSLDYGESRPLPEKIQRSLGRQQAVDGIKLVDKPRDKYTDVEVVFIGNLATATLAEKLKKFSQSPD